MDEKLNNIRKELYKELDKDRYYHTMGVMYTAASMAMSHDVELEKALYAGLLHDCAKCISDANKLKMARKYGLKISKTEEENPGLLHAKLGAYLAREKYKIKDQDIINAIASHTTGRPDMSTLEKIVYIADYIEPGRRPLPNMPELRPLAFRDLDLCLYRILEDSVKYLETSNKPIDPSTKETYLYYKERLNQPLQESHFTKEYAKGLAPNAMVRRDLEED